MNSPNLAACSAMVGSFGGCTGFNVVPLALLCVPPFPFFGLLLLSMRFEATAALEDVDMTGLELDPSARWIEDERGELFAELFAEIGRRPWEFERELVMLRMELPRDRRFCLKL